jgi:hypothetical protein
MEAWGLNDPNIGDLGFLGAPSCNQHSSLDYQNMWLPNGLWHSYSASVPSSPMLTNLRIYTMAVALQPGVNTLLGGTIISNGIAGTIGNL